MKPLKGISLMLGSIIYFVLLTPAWPADADSGVDRLKKEMMCTCGCPHLLGQCGDECGVAPEIITDLTSLLSSGQTEDEVLKLYEARYGPSIYAAPKAEGFSLLAWILPFLGLGMGALFVWAAVARLKRKPEVGTKQPDEISLDTADHYRELLRREVGG